MKKPLVFVFAVLLTGAAAASLAASRGVVLPTEWSPRDRVVATGTLPQGAALTADGAHLVVVEDGEAAADVRIFAAATLAPEKTVALGGASGPPRQRVAATPLTSEYAASAASDLIERTFAAIALDQLCLIRCHVRADDERVSLWR